jgi:hypothetical protein
MVSAWATGKTMCGILRAMVYSEMIPKNLGVIFRKEFVDLRDSTLIDFEHYTGKKVNSQRNVDLKNGSKIMFRHLEEMNNLQNLNLGWFFIEQAEELASDSEFFLLWGRLRRQLKPVQEFLDLDLPVHTGFITANVKGNNWIKTLWKSDPKEDFELTEAITADNADVLPEDFIKNIQRLKELQPERYKRFVLNDWDIEAEGLAISADLIEVCIGGQLADPMVGEQYVLGVDLAKYHNFVVIIVANKRTGQVVYFDRFNKESWGLVRGKIWAIAKRYNNAEVIPDSTGVGDPITEDLERAGCRVYKEDERSGYVFTSKSKQQLIENLIVVMTNKSIHYPLIPELIKELKELEKTESKANNIQYSAPEGKFDDCVMALALCVWGIKRIIVGNVEMSGKREVYEAMKGF